MPAGTHYTYYGHTTYYGSRSPSILPCLQGAYADFDALMAVFEPELMKLAWNDCAGLAPSARTSFNAGDMPAEMFAMSTLVTI